jgi:hypothetical protein
MEIFNLRHMRRRGDSKPFPRTFPTFSLNEMVLLNAGMFNDEMTSHAIFSIILSNKKKPHIRAYSGAIHSQPAMVSAVRINCFCAAVAKGKQQYILHAAHTVLSLLTQS